MCPGDSPGFFFIILDCNKVLRRIIRTENYVDVSEWMVFRPCRYLWKSLIFVLYLSLLFSLLFFALVVWFFCFVIYVKVGWGWALSFIFIFAEGGGKKFVVLICLLIPLCMGICCVYLFVNPPSNVLQEDNTYSYYVHLFHLFITRPTFWHYKRSSETEGVFNFKFIFIVFVYYSFSTCIRIFCK